MIGELEGRHLVVGAFASTWFRPSEVFEPSTSGRFPSPYPAMLIARSVQPGDGQGARTDLGAERTKVSLKGFSEHSGINFQTTDTGNVQKCTFRRSQPASSLTTRSVEEKGPGVRTDLERTFKVSAKQFADQADISPTTVGGAGSWEREAERSYSFQDLREGFRGHGWYHPSDGDEVPPHVGDHGPGAEVFPEVCPSWAGHWLTSDTCHLREGSGRGPISVHF